MVTKSTIEIIFIVIISVPIYAWFFKLWFGDFKEVWKRNKFKAIVPIVLPIWSIVSIWIWFS